MNPKTVIAAANGIGKVFRVWFAAEKGDKKVYKIPFPHDPMGKRALIKNLPPAAGDNLFWRFSKRLVFIDLSLDLDKALFSLAHRVPEYKRA